MGRAAGPGPVRVCRACDSVRAMRKDAREQRGQGSLTALCAGRQAHGRHSGNKIRIGGAVHGEARLPGMPGEGTACRGMATSARATVRPVRKAPLPRHFPHPSRHASAEKMTYAGPSPAVRCLPVPAQAATRAVRAAACRFFLPGPCVPQAGRSAGQTCPAAGMRSLFALPSHMPTRTGKASRRHLRLPGLTAATAGAFLRDGERPLLAYRAGMPSRHGDGLPGHARVARAFSRLVPSPIKGR